MSTTVYLLRLDFLQDPSVYEKMRACASPERRLRADRYRLSEDRIRCLGAGLLLQFVLGLRDEDLAYGPQGKPYCPARPELSFSLSHSGMLAVLAVSQRAVGADVEEIRPEKESFRLIAARYFTEEEQREVQRPSEEGGGVLDMAAFARIWTKKEAYVKMTGEGIVSLRKTGEEACFFPVTEAPEGYALSICLQGEEPEEIQFREVTPEELERKYLNV